MFRTNHPNQPASIRGALLNRQHAMLNRLLGDGARDYGGSQQQGVAKGRTVPPPGILGIARIESAEDTCAESESPNETVSPPCREQDLYLARFRYFDSTDQFWHEYDEDLPLDAAAYKLNEQEDEDESSGGSAASDQSEVPEFSAIPRYRQGDVVPCYWDEIRQQLVPIQSPGQDAPQTEFVSKTTLAIPQLGTSQLGAFDSFAAAYLEIKKPGEQWQVVTALHWRIPFLDTLTLWEETRSGFAFFAAPHGTEVRLRILKSADIELETNFSQLQLWGAGRMNRDAEHEAKAPGSMQGGAVISGWQRRSGIPHRFADQPEFTDALKIEYSDPLDEWIIGCQAMVSLQPDPEHRNQECVQLVTSLNVDCDTGKLHGFCRQIICFPGALAQRLGLGAETCTDCQ